jgi:predicted nucleic acid-binding Zn ribbon protein
MAGKMPTYVYKFIDTGETVEVQQSFDDDTLTELVHPSSGATMPVKKVFLPVGITFKGGGFYKTDSRGGSGGSATKTAASTDTSATPSTTATPAAASSSSTTSSTTSTTTSSD